MNLGGDPDRDDSSLPPVDIEIPDDARELDRDVQAYRRELRAEQRRLRARRFGGPLTHGGMVLPMLAGCLILALIAGTLLTVFSAGQTGLEHQSGPGISLLSPGAGTGSGSTGQRGSAASHPAGHAPKAAGQVGEPLPAGDIVVGGAAVPLDTLRPAVLALVPAGCRCAAGMRELTGEAASARVPVYFVPAGQTMRQLTPLAASAGKGTAARLADDLAGVLGAAYKPAGLTAVLVGRDGSVAQIARGLPPRPGLEAAIRQLAAVPTPA